jgi:hemerythrin-like domain-containing protein
MGDMDAASLPAPAEPLEATSILAREHSLIRVGLVILREMAQRLLCGGTVPCRSASQALEFLRGYADDHHHAKEERVLFPALEALGVLRQGGPLEALMTEHDHGRALLRKLDGVVPAIEDSRDAASEFAAISHVYTGLLARHICKENHQLFPEADRLLGRERDAALVAAYGAQEACRSPGVARQLEATLAILAVEFLAAAPDPS